jgi:hypothetical protein
MASSPPNFLLSPILIRGTVAAELNLTSLRLNKDFA